MVSVQPIPSYCEGQRNGALIAIQIAFLWMDIADLAILINAMRPVW